MPKLRTRSRRDDLLAGFSGLLAGAAAVAVGEGVAGLLTGVTGPLVAVGNRVVDEAPRPLKELAIEQLGTADKPVLLATVVAGVAAMAAVAGVVGARRTGVGVAIFVGLTLVAAAATLTDRAASAGPLPRLVPVIALGVVGVSSLALLVRRLDAGALRQRRVAHSADRRTFLLSAAAVAAVAAAGGVLTRATSGLAATASRLSVRLPQPLRPAPAIPAGSSLHVAGVTPYLTGNTDFYRVDTALQVPDVPLDRWELRIHGMVDRELRLTYQDLLDRGLVERRITLTCVSNPVGGEYVGNAAWVGVPIHDLLRDAGVRPGADAVRSRSADDFTAGTPLSALLDENRGALVAVGMNGEPLPLEHGFPARMVTPGLYGYVSATKWLTELEVTRFADFEAYWTRRGYAAQAPIKTSSRIDVPRSFAKVVTGRTPVAGIAWSQSRGITKVEVRVDGGDWMEATLAAEDGVDTWRQWVWQWDATAGTHLLEVRATDADGYTQTSSRAPVAPDGSTGWDSVNVTVD